MDRRSRYHRDNHFEAIRTLGKTVPHYCYDRDLSIVASCRLCFVEIEKVPKLQPSCSTPVNEGMVVYTNSEKVLEARRMQMEFLLVQHPLDCPVCDQGGECKLAGLQSETWHGGFPFPFREKNLSQARYRFFDRFGA